MTDQDENFSGKSLDNPNGKVIGNDGENQKDCSDGEEYMNKKQHATIIKEITNIVVHIEDDKGMETEGIGFPQSTGEMMSIQANNKQCYRCGCVFETEVEMKNHMADIHNDDNAETARSECNFKAKTQGGLNEHHDIKYKPRTVSKKPNT